MIENIPPLVVAFGSVATLLWLVLHLRMSPFLALVTTSILAALAAGMPAMEALETVKNGMGGTLGFIAVIVGLGSIFGALMKSGGAIEALAGLVVRRSSPSVLPWLLALMGLVIAIPVFFDVGLIILAPIVFGLATRMQRPVMALALPLLAGLATAHAFVPPTPGPLAVADLLGANIGLVALFGGIVGLPAMLVAGPIWASLLQRIGAMDHSHPEPNDSDTASHQEDTTAHSAGKALFVIALPLLLIFAGTFAPRLLGTGPMIETLVFVGHPFTALLISCGAAYALFRPKEASARADFRTACERALEPAGAVILVTGAGGAFKQVLVESGAGGELATAILDFGLSPVGAGFVLALLIRVAQGSATVAMITAAGLAAPIVEAAGLSPSGTALTVVAIAAGATAASHVNDSGFWLVSRYFNLNTRNTLKYWTTSSSLVGLVGFLGCITLAAFV